MPLKVSRVADTAWGAAVGLFVLVSVGLFGPAIRPGGVLSSPSADPLRTRADYPQVVREALTGEWCGELLGQGYGARPLFPSTLLALFLPPSMAYPAGYVTATWLLMLAMAYFLRGLGLRVWTSWLAGLTFAFSAPIFSAISSGNQFFFDTMPLAIFGLASWDRGLRRHSIFFFAWAGFLVGLGYKGYSALLEVFGLFGLVYSLFVCIRMWPQDTAARGKGLSFVFGGCLVGSACFALTALPGRTPLSHPSDHREDAHSYPSRTHDARLMLRSIPPEDMLECLLPGLLGIRSEHSQAPYWGRRGRHAGGEQQRPEFHDRRQESLYLGGVPLCMAVYALWLALGGWRHERRKHRQATEVSRRGNDVPAGENSLERFTSWRSASRIDILFWWTVLIISLLLALGSYGPFYGHNAALSHLLGFRHPHLFLYVAELCVTVLFAFGLEGFDRSVELFTKTGGLRKSKTRAPKPLLDLLAAHFRFGLVFGAVAVFLCLGRVMAILCRGFLHARWQTLGPTFATSSQTLLHQFVGSFRYAGCLVGCVATAFLVVRFFPTRKALIPCLNVFLGLLVAMDLVLVGRPYVWTGRANLPSPPNPIAEEIVKDGRCRVWCLFDTQGLSPYGSFCASLLRHGVELLPYNRHMGWPEEYRAYFGLLSRTAGRLWSLTNTRFIIGPVSALNTLATQPEFERLIRFDIQQDHVSYSANGKYLLLRFKGGLPRMALYHAWEVVPLQQAWNRLAQPNWDPNKSLLVSEVQPRPLHRFRWDLMTVEEAVRWLPIRGWNPAGMLQTYDPALFSRVSARPPAPVPEVTYRSNRIVVDVEGEEEGVLLLNDKYDPRWEARVDGKKKPLLRCNAMMRGVVVPAGRHRVEFVYRPEAGWFFVRLILFAILLTRTCLRFLLGKSRRKEADTRMAGKGAADRPEDSHPHGSTPSSEHAYPATAEWLRSVTSRVVSRVARAWTPRVAVGLTAYVIFFVLVFLSSRNTSNHPTDPFSERNTLRTATLILRGQQRWGITEDTHYPNGPAYVLLPFMPFVKDLDTLRVFPRLTAAAGVAALFTFFLLQAKGKLAGAITLSAFAGLCWQPGLANWWGALQQHSYQMNAVFIIFLCGFAFQHVGIPFTLMGFLVGWIGYDGIPVQLGAMFLSRYVLHSRRLEWVPSVKRAFWEALAGVAGVALAIVVHLAQNALYFNSVRQAWKDLAGAAEARCALGQIANLDPEYVQTLKNANNNQPFPDRHLCVLAHWNVFHKPFYSRPFLLNATLLVSVTLGVMAVWQRRTRGVAFLRDLAFVTLCAALASCAWFILMPYHGWFHFHFLPRLFFVAYLNVFAFLILAASLPLTESHPIQ